MAKHYRLTSVAMALYLFIIDPDLYKKATSVLRTAGKHYPNPLTMVHAHMALNPKFIQTLQQKLRFHVVVKPLRGASCYNLPPFFSSPLTVTIMPTAPPQHVHHPAPVPIIPAPTVQTSHPATICPQDHSPQPMEDQRAELQHAETEQGHGPVLPQLDTRDATLQ